MSDTLSDKIVEAGARAMWEAESIRSRGAPRLVPWEEAGDHIMATWRHQARACLSAALAAAEQEEVILTRVPGEVKHLFGDDRNKGHAEGWNLHHARTLAAKVTL